jgi:hypothetical protein
MAPNSLDASFAVFNTLTARIPIAFCTRYTLPRKNIHKVESEAAMVIPSKASLTYDGEIVKKRKES